MLDYAMSTHTNFGKTMPAFIVVDLTVKNPEKLKSYSQLAAETLVPFNGEFLTKGAIEVLHGEKAFQMKVIIQFPTFQQANDWYQSDNYQNIVELRNEGMTSQFHLIDNR